MEGKQRPHRSLLFQSARLAEHTGQKGAAGARPRACCLPLSGLFSWKISGCSGSSGSCTIQPTTETFLPGVDLYWRTTTQPEAQVLPSARKADLGVQGPLRPRLSHQHPSTPAVPSRSSPSRVPHRTYVFPVCAPQGLGSVVQESGSRERDPVSGPRGHLHRRVGRGHCCLTTDPATWVEGCPLLPIDANKGLISSLPPAPMPPPPGT